MVIDQINPNAQAPNPILSSQLIIISRLSKRLCVLRTLGKETGLVVTQKPRVVAMETCHYSSVSVDALTFSGRLVGLFQKPSSRDSEAGTRLTSTTSNGRGFELIESHAIDKLQ